MNFVQGIEPSTTTLSG